MGLKARTATGKSRTPAKQGAAKKPAARKPAGRKPAAAKKAAPARAAASPPARKASAGKTRTAQKSRAGNDTVDAYIDRLGEPLKAVATRLRALLAEAAPDASESIKWAQPVYEDNGPFAYLRAASGHVTIGFWRGTELSDPNGLLEGEGDKMMHLSIASLADLDEEAVRGFIEEAVAHNRERGNPTRPTVARPVAEPVAAVATAAIDQGWAATDEVADFDSETDDTAAAAAGDEADDDEADDDEAADSADWVDEGD